MEDLICVLATVRALKWSKTHLKGFLFIDILSSRYFCVGPKTWTWSFIKFHSFVTHETSNLIALAFIEVFENSCSWNFAFGCCSSKSSISNLKSNICRNNINLRLQFISGSLSIAQKCLPYKHVYIYKIYFLILCILVLTNLPVVQFSWALGKGLIRAFFFLSSKQNLHA